MRKQHNIVPVKIVNNKNDDDNNNTKKCHCDICGKDFHNRSNLSKHKRRKHSEINEKIEEEDINWEHILHIIQCNTKVDNNSINIDNELPPLPLSLPLMTRIQQRLLNIHNKK